MSSRSDQGDEVVSPNRSAMTVVVMGYRNEETIAASIASVLAQDADEPFEVVVVTSGGDGSGDVVRSKYPQLRLLESTERLMPGGARNAGVDMATGEIVAFLAADCLAQPGWVAARLGAHRDGYGAVAGSVTGAPPRRPWSDAALYLNYRRRLPTVPAGPVAWPQPEAHSLSLSAAVLDSIGPFDETVRIGEDTLVAKRLSELEVKTFFEPGACIAHRGPGSTRQLWQDQYRRGAQYVRENAVAPPGDGSRSSMVAAELIRLLRAVREAVAAGWHHHGPRSLLAFPWVLLGATALRFGRIRAFREARPPVQPG